jgi:flagellar protein FliT
MKPRIEHEREIVDRYRRMADASGRMLAAARADDWDRVCTIEKECATLVADLSKMGDLAPSDPALRNEKLEFMRRVLSDDAQIRVLSQPWLKKLDAMMRSPATTRQLNRAYGAGLLRN